VADLLGQSYGRRQDAHPLLEVSLDGITSEDRKTIREALEEHCRDLLAA
jgi:hypothetical protein